MHETLGGVPDLTIEEVVNEFCPVLEDLKIHWFEQPYRGVDSYIAIKHALKTVMVSGGEMNWSRFRHQALDRQQRPRHRADRHEQHRALRELAHLAHRAPAREVPLSAQLARRAHHHRPTRHLVAAIPNRHMLELNSTHNPLKEEIFKDPLVVKKGYMDLPDRPRLRSGIDPGCGKEIPVGAGFLHAAEPADGEGLTGSMRARGRVTIDAHGPI